MGEKVRTSNRSPVSQKIGFWFGILTFLLLTCFGGLKGENAIIGRMAAIAVLMAIWWITDAVPLAATSLVPLVLYPLFGIMPGKELAPVYINYVIFLFLGGFLIALAMERWNLHRRIALNIINFVGSKPSRLVLGFMVATAFLSMWISNIATATMMLAIGLAVIKQTEDSFGEGRTKNLSIALLLGIAYSASIGGMATIVGTPPNLALVRIFELSFPKAVESGYYISFGQWMIFALPLSLILLSVVWLILTRVLFRSGNDLEIAPEILRKEKEALGPMKFEEIAIAIVFATTALLWVFRRDLTLGDFTLPGWSGLLPFGSLIDDGTIAVTMALTLFLIPSRKTADNPSPHHTLLDGSVFAKIPWHIILLFGGGFALAKGFQVSGLSEWVGGHFTGLEDSPTWVIVASLCGGITFLTELTSNTATTEMILPLLASIATAAKIHPLFLMIPATVAASCAFMMPVATPPNALVFSSGKLRVADMVKAGIFINLIAIVVVTGVFLLLGPTVFQIDPEAFPEWAH